MCHRARCSHSVCTRGHPLDDVTDLELGLPQFIPWQPWNNYQQTAVVIGTAAVLGLLSLLVDRLLYLPVTALLMYGCGTLWGTDGIRSPGLGVARY